MCSSDLAILVALLSIGTELLFALIQRRATRQGSVAATRSAG